MAFTFSLFYLIVLSSLAGATAVIGSAPPRESGGKWHMLRRNIGVSAMHLQSLPNGNVIAFDRTTAGPSGMRSPSGRCLRHDNETDCFVHSVEFNPRTLEVRPLTLLTDSWCSSGGLSPDGVMVQTGGWESGRTVVRYLKPGLDSDWAEDPTGLLRPRWYASNQILPNGQMIIVGGRGQFSYEFVPRKPQDKLHDLSFLGETYHKAKAEGNLYPFLHLAPDGNLFIFANDRAILLDYLMNKVLWRYPVFPSGLTRNYPSTGSSVLLPLNISANGVTREAEVLICGGTVPDSYFKANISIFLPATNTCGRISITAKNPTWEIEEMPLNRIMGDMILLPTGDVLIINGGGAGSAGWELGREPVFNPVLYRPGAKNGTRFQTLAPTTIPRMYHSTALLLPGGRVLVGGNNPHIRYTYNGTFPTDLSLEVFSPPYFDSSVPRPKIAGVVEGTELGYKQRFSVVFSLRDAPEIGVIQVTMVAPAFTTHSFSMHQRVLVLATEGMRKRGASHYVVDAFTPATAELAPPGYYMVFLAHQGFPSKSIWVRVK